LRQNSVASTSEQEDMIVIARLTIAAAALASIAVPALAASAGPAPNETRIRQIGSRLEIVPDPRHGLYIQDYRGRWFYARTQGDCPRLTFNARLRLAASPGGYFDTRSSVIADGWRCLVASVTTSDGPPRHRRR
jgi:hypothetical protein